MDENFQPTFDPNGIPLMLNWTPENVGAWIRVTLNYPEYEECFVRNCISGRKLILIDASNLQKIGVQDFKHIQAISKEIRRLLGVEEPFWNRSVTLPPRDPVPHFLERKSICGTENDALSFEQHFRDLQRFNKHWD